MSDANVTTSPAVADPVLGGPMGAAMQALKLGMSMSDVKEMLPAQREWEANEARKAFAEAMVAFKLNPPQILKDTHVSYQGEAGMVDYDHASIGEVCEKITIAAAEHGFSSRWKPSTPKVKGNIAITCVITHRQGHFEETTLDGPSDESAGMNAIQGVGSSATYLSRYTLLLGYGFATRAIKDPDGRVDPLAPAGSSYDAAENLRYWNDLAAKAKTVQELDAVRKQAGGDFNQAKDVTGWEAHKVAVEACRAALEGAVGKKAKAKA